MELRHLRYFMVVAEELHFGKAALRLKMTQPPLSQQIKQLESEIGVTLLKRSKRAVKLTAAGDVFLKQIKEGLSQIDQAVDMAQRTARGELGRLVIGFVGSATYEIMPPIIREYRKQFPSVNIELRELSTPNQIEALLNGHIDIGVLHPPLGNDELKSYTVKKSHCVLALPKYHPLTKKSRIYLRDLEDESLIAIDKSAWPSLYTDFIFSCEQAGFIPNIAQEATEYQMVIGLVSAGMGIAVVPTAAKRLFNLDVVYREIDDLSLRAEWVTAHRKDNRNPALQHFIEVSNEVSQS
ncbi:LysR family transcriptional regulator [Bacillus glycinifermentans]|uniref:LysR family transcriptional regulator n=1 Tax=Bacillus glycinifermentans TaxID=1664069 RepID=A0A0J6EM34_9BACI|nr:LysR family transcriptional regulator [Bacillus glycinifermentans]KMM56870.1 LysR family transcriptional regulator [Bacillus glycinifermentans]KRT90334.1 LysR family transcriptional regulator [Bacillus glycinifermentans]MEC0484030.1 LysR family transcriptional regulator [Bacillus glycinifermentans]MEC0492851.1 LysR family transcriptional regulator [Bacillus glycinifermentans]MEC0539933.1 LysR family transcriptional regulator [Bacillus glycinifermentans]